METTRCYGPLPSDLQAALIRYHYLTEQPEPKERKPIGMETLSVIKAAILDGTLRPDEETLAYDIIQQHGKATFLVFLSCRQAQADKRQAALQADINKKLGLSEAVFAKYSH